MPGNRDKDREWDQWYLNDYCDDTAWAGELPEADDEVMTHADIVKYIGTGRPDLVKRLHGLPVKSTDIPMSFHGQKTLQRLAKAPITQRNTPWKRDQATPTPPRTPKRQSKHISGHGVEELITQLKSRIEHKLSNGFGLYEHIISHCEEYPTCSSTLCLGPDVHPNGSRVYYTLEYDVLDAEKNPFADAAATEYFCAPCFGRIFPFGPGTQPSSRRTSAQDQLVLDGVSHHTILETAQGLYPDLKPEKLKQKDLLDNKGYPDHAFNYPTNSVRAQQLRAHTQHEINRDLAAVARYEKAIAAAKLESERKDCQNGSSEADLLIMRPAYIAPKKDWYKRQGLEGLEGTQVVQDNKENNCRPRPEPRTPLKSPSKSTFRLEPICYCREADDGTELLHCSAERCPIGWFHLKCTGLKRLPTIREQFFCCYCSDNVGEVVSKELLEDHIELGTPATAEFPPSSPFNTITGGRPRSSTEQGEEFDSDYDEDWSPKAKTLHTRVMHWTAINEKSPSSFSATAGDDESDSDESNIVTVRALSSLETTDGTTPHSSVVDTSTRTQSLSPRNPSTITDSTTRTPTPSSLSPATSLPAALDDTTRHRPAAPSTPLLQPTYCSSKPWGTPINVTSPALKRLPTLSEPESPSPTKGMKRKFEMIGLAEDEDDDEETEADEEGRDAEMEIPDSQEDELGEEVPFVLDERDL